MHKGGGGIRVSVADCEALPFKSYCFDLITSRDVLEHIDDDARAIEEFKRVLKSEGILVILVPAFKFLWTTRDERHYHKRRYTKFELIEKVENGGLDVLKCSYIHLFYLPAFVFTILFHKLLNKHEPAPIKTDIASVNPVLNYIFLKMLDFESFFLRYFDYPVWVGIVCVARKI